MRGYLFGADGAQLRHGERWLDIETVSGQACVLAVRTRKGYVLNPIPIALLEATILDHLNNVRLSWDMLYPRNQWRTFPTLAAVRAYLTLRGEEP